MSQILADFYVANWPYLIAVVLLGAVSPALVRAQGLPALVVAALGTELAVIVTRWVITPGPMSSLVTPADFAIALSMGLVVGAVLRVRRVPRSAVSQAAMGVLVAILAVIAVPVAGVCLGLVWFLIGGATGM
jgi:hypothetical protein